MLDLNHLNTEQAAAVQAGAGPQLILAGPGTGKTRTLVSRFAFLADQGVDPKRILTATFTRKAAEEMAQRLRSMLPSDAAHGLWIGTFHSLAGRMLRWAPERAGLTADFRIVNAQQQHQLLAELGIRWDADNGGELLDIIAAAKDHLLDPQSYRAVARAKINREGRHLAWMLDAAEAYARYQAALEARNAVDFGDLINHVVALMRGDPDLCQRLSRRFDHILVDEFQDVNPAQVALLRSLTTTHSNLWAVGDDDQTLYGFRASDVRHILDFPRWYPDTCTHKLQENYRSTGNILAPSLALIAHNRNRFDKTLRATKGSGSRVVVAGHPDAAAESDWLAASARKLHDSGLSYKDIAVLCRVGHIGSRLQLVFRDHGIPVVLRGVRDFWSSPEVKAVVNILALARNQHDSAARQNLGQGRRSEMFARVAAEIGPRVDQDFPSAVSKAVRVVANVKMPNRSSEYTDRWARNTRLAGEIADAAGGLDALTAQIEREQTGRQAQTQDAVVLSTVHAAKGLEWDAVFVAGFEAGVLPHDLAADVEEERRIAFVAMTRAKRYLAVSYASQRDGAGAGPSRFLQEAMSALDAARVDWRANSPAPWIVAERRRAKAAGKTRRKRSKQRQHNDAAGKAGSQSRPRQPQRAHRDPPMVGSVPATRHQADWTDGELDTLARMYHRTAGELLTLAQTAYRTPSEVAGRILNDHYGIQAGQDECPEGRLFLEAADRRRLPDTSLRCYDNLIQAARTQLPASQVRGWLITPRPELADISPAAYASRAGAVTETVMNVLARASVPAPVDRSTPDPQAGGAARRG